MRKLYERLSSLTPLLQGKQINYLPMMVGALKHQGVKEETIKDLVNLFLKKMPVGDLGEKLYPKSTFDEYYIHKTNYYLGQLKQRPFDKVLANLMDKPGDLGVSYDFAGILRLYYALLSENELSIAEALALLDLSIEQAKEPSRNRSFLEIKSDLEKNYKETQSKEYLLGLLALLALKEMAIYLPDFTSVINRLHEQVTFLKNPKNIRFLSIKEIKEADMVSLDEPLLMIAYDLLKT